MPAISSHLDEFAGFVRQLHQRPDVSGNRKPGVSGARPPFYQPAPGCPSIPLSNSDEGDLLQRLGMLLWRTLGYTQVRLYPALQGSGRTGMEAAARRPLASGGARYPVDLHVLVPADAGGALAPFAGKVLTYTPQYHRLFITGRFEANPVPVMPGALAIVVSLDFLRTWEKYGDFGYRLSAVDAGLVIGRLHALASRWSAIRVEFNFDADKLDAALGLDSACQAGYCVVHVRPHAGHEPVTDVAPDKVRVSPPALTKGRLSRRFVTAHRLAQASPAAAHTWPQSMLQFIQPQPRHPVTLPLGEPPAQTDAIHTRRSRAHAFTGASLGMEVVRDCIDGIRQSLQGLRAAGDTEFEVPRLLLCCLQVAGLTPGLYEVDAQGPALIPLAEGDHGAALADAQLLSSFDLRKCSFIVHVCTRRWQAGDPRGPRAYRIDQMLAGVALDAGTLAVSTSCVSAHAYLGFDADALARLYGVRNDVNVAAQLCIGVTATGCELAYPVFPHGA